MVKYTTSQKARLIGLGTWPPYFRALTQLEGGSLLNLRDFCRVMNFDNVDDS